MQTTLNKIKSHNPCQNAWEKLLAYLGKTQADDEVLELRTILESNGLDDTIWAMRAVEGKDKEIRLFAADCAEMVLPIYEKFHPNDDRPRNAIQAARDYANGLIELSAESEVVRKAANAASHAQFIPFNPEDPERSEGWSDAARNAGWAAARCVQNTDVMSAYTASSVAMYARVAKTAAAREAARVAAWSVTSVAEWSALKDGEAAAEGNAINEIKSLLLKYI